MSKGQSPPTSRRENGLVADNEPGPADLDRMSERLVPFRLYYFSSLASTNDTAADLAREGAAAPAVVVAGRQTAGRGQRGRSWFSGRDSVAATFLLPIMPDRPIQHLPILAGLAVREALASLTGENGLKVKWPNDVLLHGRKVSGVLCERRHGVDLVGAGINVRHAPDEVPPELTGSSIALADVCHTPLDRWEVLAAVTAPLGRHVLQESAPLAWRWALAQWPLHDSLLGEDVEVETPLGRVVGRSHGIDTHGQLHIVTSEGQARFIASGSVRRLQ